MTASLTFELMMGDGLELSVDEGKKIVDRLVLASRNLPEQSRDGVLSHTARSFQPRTAAREGRARDFPLLRNEGQSGRQESV
jgi:hypothetical protein